MIPQAEDPRSVEVALRAERALLALVMFDRPTCYHDIPWEDLELIDPVCAATLQAVHRSWEKNKRALLPMELEDYLAHQASLSVPVDHVTNWMMVNDCQTSQLDGLCDLLIQCTVDRKVRNRLQAGLVSDAHGNHLHEEVRESLDAIEMRSTEGAVSLRQAITDWTYQLEAESKGVDTMQTGYSDFDECGLLSPGGVLTIAGRPSMGKSALALWMALALAKQGEKILWFGTETSQHKFMNRLAAQITHRNSKHISGKNKSQELWRDITRAGSELTELSKDGQAFWIDDQSDRKASIVREIRRAKSYGRISVVVIDHIQECIPNMEPRLEVNQLLSAVRSACRDDPKIALILLSQLNRSVESTPTKIPMLGHLKESGKIEEVSDSVIFAFRPYYYRERGVELYSSAEKDLMIVDIAKNRDGETGRMKFAYDKGRGQVRGPMSKREDL